MKVVIGSGNPGKLAELTALLRENGLEPVSGGDYLDDVPETGSSPQENARIKALSYAKVASPCRASLCPVFHWKGTLASMSMLPVARRALLPSGGWQSGRRR